MDCMPCGGPHRPEGEMHPLRQERTHRQSVRRGRSSQGGLRQELRQAVGVEQNLPDEEERRDRDLSPMRRGLRDRDQDQQRRGRSRDPEAAAAVGAGARAETAAATRAGTSVGTRAETTVGSATAADGGVVIRRGRGAETRGAAGAGAAAEIVDPRLA